jgi:hypothetical protein
MIFLFYQFYSLAWSGLLVGYTVEILPYNMRAKGMTILFISVSLALFFNQYINPIALAAIHWKYYIVFVSLLWKALRRRLTVECVWLAFELVVVNNYYIETRNTSLEEIVKYFDGEDAIVGGGAASKKVSDLKESGQARTSMYTPNGTMKQRV